MRVMIRGEVYETVREAAEAFGVRPSWVYDAIERGRTDYIGVGSGKHRGNEPIVGYGTTIKLYGLTFPSMLAASKALGFSPSYVRCALRRGSEYSKERIKFACMRYAAKMEMEPICRSK